MDFTEISPSVTSFMLIMQCIAEKDINRYRKSVSKFNSVFFKLDTSKKM